MTESILQKEKRCYICGSAFNLERHHIMSGTANRKLSERFGLVVWLCADHHRGRIGVHTDYILNERLRRDAQLAFEAEYGHKMWMQTFRKNYV
jgi:hypothetical protein